MLAPFRCVPRAPLRSAADSVRGRAVANFQDAPASMGYRVGKVLTLEDRVKLFSLPLSPFAARVRAAIYAKNLPIEIVSPPSDWRTSADYRKLNPLVRIPVLVLDDGTALPESGIIVEYLEDQFPQNPLRPGAAKDLARVRFITQVAETYVLQAMSPLWTLFDPKKPGDPAAITAQIGKLDSALKPLNDLLTPGAYAFGDRLTTADAWLAPLRFTLDGMMTWSGHTDLLDKHPNVQVYADVARRDPHLARVWREMEEALKVFLASLKAS
jgi:glutathione S-transferase